MNGTHPIFNRRVLLIAAALVLATGAAALCCASVIRLALAPHLTVLTFTQNDVEVTVDIARYARGEAELSATFTPTRPGFRLFSKDLPKTGIAGFAYPTLVEPVGSGSVKCTGPLLANRFTEPLNMEFRAASFPAYPAGPVTLSLPCKYLGHDKSVSIEIILTYTACSDQSCLPPVVNKHQVIEAPASFFER